MFGSRVAVPALIHDAGEIHAPAGGFRDVPGSQGVRPKGRGIEPSGLRVAFDDTHEAKAPCGLCGQYAVNAPR